VARPQRGEALVRVHAAAITRDELTWPVDRLPAIPSYELSGVVAKVAPDVRDLAAGDEVFALTPFDRDGVAAEYALVPAVVLAAKPRSLTHVESAALTLAGLSAWQGLFDHGGLREGERVRVLGASGGAAISPSSSHEAAGRSGRAVRPRLRYRRRRRPRTLRPLRWSSGLRRGGGGRRDILRRRAKSRPTR
jgi:D-arabinose 1-dehydrogenase-like Zn-dependent alcohol dehydrogenase